MEGLAIVTQLRRLELTDVSPPFQFASLLPLTSLTALTKMTFDWRPIDPEAVDDDLDLGFDCEAEVSQSIGKTW